MHTCIVDHIEFQDDCKYCILQKIALLEARLRGLNIAESKLTRQLAEVMFMEIQELRLRVAELTSQRARMKRKSS